MEKNIKPIRRCRDFSSFKMAVKDRLSSAEAFQATSQEITQHLLDLKKHYNVPRRYWDWCWGYLEARQDNWHRYKLVYAHVWGGEKYTGWENLPEDLKEALRNNQNARTKSGHYWKNADGTIGQPYFVSLKEEPGTKPAN